MKMFALGLLGAIPLSFIVAVGATIIATKRMCGL